jgi:hypothetical protein
MKSVLAKLLGKIMSLAVLAALAWAGWYAYTHWTAASTDASDSTHRPAFNCRQALARLAEDQACRTSDSCFMTSDEVAQMKQTESDIAQYCN